LHGDRLKKHGSVELQPRPSVDARFDAKWVLDPRTGCHVWTGAKHPMGYGNFNRGDRRFIAAHQFAWERRNGPVPVGLVLDHFVCSNPPCCNPSHLKVVTRGQNVLRSDVGPSARNAAKTHCDHGHEFTPDNTYRPPKRPHTRQCIACIRRRTRIAART
jgi:hypothetical protein